MEGSEYEFDQGALDTRVQEYYSGLTGWDEHARLTALWAQGPVEHTRTQELIDAALTIARALSTTPGVPDVSQHIVAIGTVAL